MNDDSDADSDNSAFDPDAVDDNEEESEEGETD